ncbi:unnamed protein product [Lupinus luteus]|uniref:Uncharacterized protein n=1 Tax=Lupinus luteus TaxID=3873 RepID=A0AAV1WPC1_LUPLU
MCFSFGVFSLELNTTLPPSSFLSTHAHPPHHHHHHNHHSHIPAKPPTQYIHTTTHAPPKPPIHPFRTSDPVGSIPHAAFQGNVFKKSCKYAGQDILKDATPVTGAVVKLVCNLQSMIVTETAKTNGSGYFYLEVVKIRTTHVRNGNCRIFLVSAPNGLRPSNYNGGIQGAGMRQMGPTKNGRFMLYNVGPLAFEPNCP